MIKLLAALMLLPTLAFGMTVEQFNLTHTSEPMSSKAKEQKLRTIELDSKNSMNFNQAFDSTYIAQKQLEAISKCVANAGKDIYIVLYTPGGSISAGQLFFDTLHALPCTFHTITIFSASMGYQTVQNLGKRYILPSGVLMSHRARVSGLDGEVYGELDSILNLIKKTVKELDVIASNRVGITLEDYREQVRDELWLTGHEAVQKNHADEVILVRCGQSLLNETTLQTVSTFFGSFEVEYSNCPIITGPISVKPTNRSSKPKVFKNYVENLKKHVKTTL